MSHVIVTSSEELSIIVSQAVRREVGAIIQDMARKDPRESLKPEQAAEYLGQSANTLRQWRSQGRGPAYEKRGRSIRYKLEDLEIWRNANRVLTGEALESLPSARSAKRPLPAAVASHG